MKTIILKITILLNISCCLLADTYRDQFKVICGQNKAVRRIIGGKDASIGEYPWIARMGLLIPDRATPDFFCGGSLFTDRHVLTAEHCLYSVVKKQQAHQLVISLGDHNAIGARACDVKRCSIQPIIYRVSKIIPYTLDETTFKNDISILELATKVEFNKWIRPICLPSNISAASLVGEYVETIGFGLVNTRTQQKAEILQKITIKVRSLKRCNMFIEPVGPGQLCAGDPNKDSCSGDSGGPLLKLITEGKESRYTLVGIVSFGSVVCENKKPAVYTDVNYYMNWIDRQLARDGFL